MTWHHMTWHDMSQPTKYLTSRHLKPNHLNSSHLATNHMTSYSQPPPTHHQTEGLKAENLVWASHWLMALRAFYRQILSLAYRLGFFPETFSFLARELLVYYTFKLFCLLNYGVFPVSLPWRPMWAEITAETPCTWHVALVILWPECLCSKPPAALQCFSSIMV